MTWCNLSDSRPAIIRICFVWYTYSLLLAATYLSTTWSSNPYKTLRDFREIEIIFCLFVFAASPCLFYSLHRTCSRQDRYSQFFAMPHLQSKSPLWTHTDPRRLSHKLSEISSEKWGQKHPGIHLHREVLKKIGISYNDWEGAHQSNGCDIKAWERKVCTGAVCICRHPPSSPVLHIDAFTHFQSHSLNQFHWTKGEIIAMYSADILFSSACVTWQNLQGFLWCKNKVARINQILIVRSWG